ncbi:hypothetical protein BDV27DRAFT_163510 [Aspergillus caelatus]|uniref:Major facilitator superfamily domain-containing protein n=1 Tax=Aspergillus caelatus TaxID=61420 RepID=A0A5N6ZLL8_9EURO|nr:uncharacterized protein BDV27DRAFT_163510 [Aspergillus caelatus]KAE8358512.1 hypothetical protein BDV27DRAFT_163510 [Aspergillus caelatus]
MPMKIFKAPSFLPLVIVVLLSYMSFGNLQWYMVLWQQDIRECSICPDFIYTAAQIVASNSVSQRDQGIAGSLIRALNLYGCSLGIGFGSTVEAYVHIKTGDVLFGYRASLYFGIALVAIAILLDALLVRVKKDERQGWGVTEESHDI